MAFQGDAMTPTPTERSSLGTRPFYVSESDQAVFVGSPDQLLAPPPIRHDLSHPTTFSPRTRPSFTARSPSTPLTHRTRPLSTSERISSGIMGLQATPSHVERQWTVFGQLMENDTQNISPTPRSRPSSRTRAEPDEQSDSISSAVHTPRRSHVERIRQEQSPEHISNGESSNAVRHPPLTSSVSENYEHDQGSESDSDHDSETDVTESTATLKSPPSHQTSLLYHRIPTLPTVYRNVLKCSIAYFLASLFTFSPLLARLISNLALSDHEPRRPFRSGHLVATIVVYYNPAKTRGAMIEADLFCFFGLFYAAFVCLMSMSMFWWLELQPGWEWLGDVVAVLWIGVSMSFVAWAKLRMANPSFNTACSMVGIIISIVIIKEGGFKMLCAVATVVVCGSFISNLVCYLLWPQSAISNLQTGMIRTIDSFSTVLTMLMRTFLLEGDVHNKMHLEKMQKAVENHQSSFTSLKKNLTEARTEWFHHNGAGKFLRGNNPGKRAYEDAVDSLNRLGQHLNGLRTGTRLQHELVKAGVVRGRFKRGKNLADLGLEPSFDDDEETGMLKAAAMMFGDIVDELGPPLKALSAACNSSLIRLREVLEDSQSRKKELSQEEFIELIDGIERALVRFESTSNHAVLRLYRRPDPPSKPHSIYSADESAAGSETGNSLLLGNEHENVFLVYFFIFTLQEFSREVVSLVDAIRRIYQFEQERANRGSSWQRIRAFFSCKRTRYNPWMSPTSSSARREMPSLRRSLSSYIFSESRRAIPYFPKIRPHAPNTIQTPPRNKLPFLGRVNQTLWTIGKRMTERDTKYAFKVGMAIALLAAPAFFDATRPIFVTYWGDWAIISFFAVISPTIGATNYLGLQRILGTLFGAAVAAGIFSAFSDSPVVLSIFGFLFSLPCFYYAITKPEYASASRFVLLTYNLSCLYCYNLRQKDIWVVSIALHRALAVTAGVIWAGFVSRFWWPAEARRELMQGLGDFCLNLGWLYTRLVASNSFSPEYRNENGEHDDEEEGALLTPVSRTTMLHNSIQEFMAMELHLQIKLIELQGLLRQAQHEPRLKGPFPVLLYRGILTSLQTILDKLHGMRCVTTREEWYTTVRHDFIIPVNRERREMVGNIILSFSTLASAFRLRAPLPPYLPPAEKARQRLVAAIRRLDVVKNRDVKGSRQLLFFAYALTMKGVTEELESLGRTLQTAFGVIGQTPEEFEALFVDPEEGRRRIDYVA